MDTTKFATIGQSKIYRRETLESLQPTTNRSLIYWRAQARAVFQKKPEINIVECVLSGRKTDSQIMKRGNSLTPTGVVVIIASTGGRYGKSRKVFNPA
jgi:hypothetical protein